MISRFEAIRFGDHLQDRWEGTLWFGGPSEEIAQIRLLTSEIRLITDTALVFFSEECARLQQRTFALKQISDLL